MAKGVSHPNNQNAQHKQTVIRAPMQHSPRATSFLTKTGDHLSETQMPTALTDYPYIIKANQAHDTATHIVGKNSTIQRHDQSLHGGGRAIGYAGYKDGIKMLCVRFKLLSDADAEELLSVLPTWARNINLQSLK